MAVLVHEALEIERFLLDEAGIHVKLLAHTLGKLEAAGILSVDDLRLFPSELDLVACGLKKGGCRVLSKWLDVLGLVAAVLVLAVFSALLALAILSQTDWFTDEWAEARHV